MKRTLIAAALTLSFALPALADSDMTKDPKAIKAGTYMLDKSHGKITWSVNHLGFSTYRGAFPGTEAKLTIDPATPERTMLTASVDTGSVATLNEKLDDELKSDGWLNSEKFPKATFEATKVEYPYPASQLKSDGLAHAQITGNLTLNGVTKPEVMMVTFNQAWHQPCKQ